jgi:hypothetical protein
MTSLGRETVLAYSGGLIDRAASQRNDPGWIDATLARAGTRLIVNGTVSNGAVSNGPTRLWITPKVIHRRRDRVSPLTAARRTLAE